MALTATSFNLDSALPDWRSTVDYFRQRRAVIFLSYCRFWESHAFVQQCLAKRLTAEGVQVEWWDGEGYRRYEPVLYWNSPHLKVVSSFALPGRRWPWVVELDRQLFKIRIQRAVKRYGNPVIWVQGGLREPLARSLPYLDIFSTFDDPFFFPDRSSLLEKARVVVAQNGFTWNRHGADRKNVLQLLPPVDMSIDLQKGSSAPPFPERFPKRVMGYIGSFFPEDYDLELFEYLVRTLPDWGFCLAGRTNAEGEQKVQALKKYPNFHRLPWMPREEVVGLWKRLSVTLLLHRPRREQYGAFPTKVLESFYFGVPCVGTDVPKTADLRPSLAVSSYPSEIRRLAVEAAAIDKGRLRAAYDSLARRTEPEGHLAQVAAKLKEAKA